MADLSEHLGRSRSGSSEAKASILLVDDSPANLLSLQAILDDLGQHLVEARSGEGALERLKAEEFAVVLLDVLMPGMSGFDTARAIRADERSRHTPIIFLTASDIDRSQTEEAYRLGAVDFLVKPLLPVALQAKVRGFVELFQEKQRAKQEAEQLRLLVQGTTDYAIFLLDPTGRVVTWNTGAERLKGYKAEEIVGQHFSKFYPQEAIDRGWPAHELKVAAAEGRFEDEGWRLRKDGSRFWANVVITALKDERGNLLSFSKITRDLSARKQAEDNARRLAEETAARKVAHEERERLRVTLASIGDAVISTDAEGRVDFLNPVAEGLVGWKPGDAAGRSLEDVFRIVNENTRQPVENPALRALKEGVIVGLANHTVLVSKDGTERPIDDSAAPIRDAESNVVGSVLVFRDITERRQAQERLREQQEWLRVTLASIGDAVIATDTQGRVTFLNGVAEGLTGWTQADAKGQPLEAVFPILNEQTRQPVENPVEKVLRDGAIVGLANHTVLTARDGTERPIDDSAAPIRDAAGGLIGVVLTFRDVTDQRRAERHRNARLAVTHALSEAAGVDDGAGGVLRAVCENLGWDVGFFWTANEDGSALACRRSWHRPGVPVDEFERASCSRTFKPEEGLPGRVWATGQPTWVLDIAEDANFPRLASAVAYGLHSAFAYPIAIGDQTLGVIEFFTKRIREADADLLEMMGTVAGNVGQFIERKAAEDELRRSERELADFFENATVGLHWVGPDGTILRANKAELDMLGYHRKEYVGRPIAEFHADEDVICDILKRLKAGEKLDEYLARLRCKDGSIKEVLIDSSVLWKDGEFIHTRCFTRDVTERKRAEAALRHSEERFRSLMEQAPFSIQVFSPDGHTIRVNRAWEELWGVRFEQIEGYNVLEDRQLEARGVLHHIHQGFAGQAAHIPAIQYDPNETIPDITQEADPRRWLSAVIYPIKDADGRVREVVLIHEDITARHRAEEALRESEQRFRQLADAMPQIVWTARPDGNIDYLNRRWTEFSGLPDNVGNEGWGSLLHPDEAQAAGERWAASVRSGAPFELEMRLLDRAKQSYRWHLIRTVAVKNEAGAVVRWYGTGTDIHEQKRAEESARYLSEASAALAGVVDYESTLQKVANLAVPHFADWSAVDVADDGGTLRRLAVAHQDPEKVRLAHELMREYPPDPQAPVGAVAVFRTGKPEMVREITDDMLVQGARDERHLGLIRSLGLKSFVCVPLAVSGNTIGVLTFATAESGRSYTVADLALAVDLANRASVAVENTQLYQALREADRRKDEFLATLAHELRNPLAPIRNSLQILKMPRVDAATVERSRDMMERQVHHLVRLVDDLLDVSRVMRGKIELRKERVELATVVARAVETVQPLVDAQGHQLSVRLTADSLPVDADPVRLAQVVGNLLTNAAKYTEPHGRIWLTAEREGGMAVLRVRDTGIGVAPQMLPRIFELFVQVDHASTKAQGGLGIGLTLVKNLVEMHNGTVEARSEGLGKGSEFVVRLPVSAQGVDPDQGDEAGQQVVQPAASGYRLLVVDDNQDAADSLAMLLRLQGHEVRVAFSGVAALEMTKAYAPDLVFLDIGMPGMDGYEVARRMRQQPGLEKVVLAALTGWGQKEDRRRTAEAGFNHHLVKPPDPNALEGVLAELKLSKR